MVSYAATTDAIRVTVRPAYLDGKSNVVAQQFTFAYFVRIENRGDGEVQLLRRSWVITDSEGHVQEVEGEGVIGKQPVIQPGESHEYQSFCVLRTFQGKMEGTYLMQRESGDRFRAQIPTFYLRALAN